MSVIRLPQLENSCGVPDSCPRASRTLDACPMLPNLTALDLGPAAADDALSVDALCTLSHVSPRLASLKIGGWYR